MDSYGIEPTNYDDVDDDDDDSCGTPTSAVVFHSVGKRLTESLCPTLCMNSVMQKN